jgi:hypothetical protein
MYPAVSRRALAAAVTALALLAPVLSPPARAYQAATSGIARKRPAKLAFGHSTFPYASDYGEPGLSIDPKGTVYVTTPGQGGAVMARSDDMGKTWTQLPTVTPPDDSPGQATSGGDSDVAVAPDGTVFVGDLTLDGIEISKSTDHGKTFEQQAFIASSSDREWITTEGEHGEIVYVAWHELATGTMLVAVSQDAGATFGPPQSIYSNPDTAAESGHNGTSIGQIVADGRGNVYVLYGVTRPDTTDTTTGTPPISDIKMSVSRDHGATWSDYEVNPGAADANYGNFWMAAGVDKAGNVYAVYSGYAHKGEPMHVWLQESTDQGETWTDPIFVDDKKGQDLFGWVAGGGRGVAVVAWYHTDSADKNADDAKWVVKVAQARGLTTKRPYIQTATASDHVMHIGGICTLGIFCGVLPGSSSDRSLLDFFKVAVDPKGRVEVVWSDNNRPGTLKTGVGFARQSRGQSAFDPRILRPKRHSRVLHAEIASRSRS